jgi:hypothetical protein
VSGRRARAPGTRRRTLFLLPQPTASASPAVRLGLQLRNEANLTGRCACGATRQNFEVLDDGTLVPVAAIEPGPGRAFYSRFEHEDDCPAIAPDLDRALARGEILDPAGDLLSGLREDSA